MIEINDKRLCCGCGACEQICPKKSISMVADNEGFLYPQVDYSSCVNCHLCERVCPVINHSDNNVSPQCYAARTNDEGLRAQSSSGGIFTECASYIIKQGGVVFGARFLDDWSVAHDYTDNLDGLSLFRGSKYVQSRLGDVFSKVKFFLELNRLVLFSGTPCQVSGLKHFLRKDYDNLITLDIVCHSISSPKVWKMYLDEISQGHPISNVTFRDKKLNGWKDYGILIESQTSIGYRVLASGGHLNKDANLYMRAFLTNLITRPSCYSCPARNYSSGSDIMLADFWHIEKYHPEWDDNKGMSLAIVNSDKGNKIFDSIKDRIIIYPIPYNEVEDRGVHAPITRSTLPHPYRNIFFKWNRIGKLSITLKMFMTLYDFKVYVNHGVSKIKKLVLSLRNTRN